MDKVFVAIDASALCDVAVPLLDLDWILKTAHRERERVEEAVVGFGDPFHDRIMRQMAIVTDSNVVVAALLP